MGKCVGWSLSCWVLFFIVGVAVVGAAAKVKGTAEEQCDLYTGSWVLDESYPLYQPATCPFIEREFRCIPNGRPDLIYTHYRWQPLACDLLRFVGNLLSNNGFLCL